MTLQVALIAGSEAERQRLKEFASSHGWQVAGELPGRAVAPGKLREAAAQFDAVLAYERAGSGADVFMVRYCKSQGIERRGQQHDQSRTAFSR